MATKIQIRRDTAANWTTNDPVLSVGEQGFETDSNKMKIGDGTSAWSALEYVAGGATSLEVQAPASANEYYIYVGQSVNKLANIQDTRGNVTNLVYDQEFATLQEALDFVQSNTLKDVGYSVNRDTYMAAAWVIAIEDGVEISNGGTYWSLAQINEQILLLNQFALDPAGGTATGTTIGNSSSLNDSFVIYNCGQLQIGGDLIFDCRVQIGHSNIKWFYNQYTNAVSWVGRLQIYDGSTFYTDGVVNLKAFFRVEVGSYASFSDVTVNNSSARIDDGSNVRMGNLTVIGNEIEVSDSSVLLCDAISISDTTFVRDLKVRNNSTLQCGTITFGDNTRFQSPEGGCKITHNGILGTSANTTFQMEPSGTQLDLAGFTAATGFANVLLQDGNSFHYEGATANTLSVPNMPTVDPADGGKSFYLNAGVMTLSS